MFRGLRILIGGLHGVSLCLCAVSLLAYSGTPFLRCCLPQLLREMFRTIFGRFLLSIPSFCWKIYQFSQDFKQFSQFHSSKLQETPISDTHPHPPQNVAISICVFPNQNQIFQVLVFLGPFSYISAVIESALDMLRSCKKQCTNFLTSGKWAKQHPCPFAFLQQLGGSLVGVMEWLGVWNCISSASEFQILEPEIS